MSTVCKFSNITVKEFLHQSQPRVGRWVNKCQNLINVVCKRPQSRRHYNKAGIYRKREAENCLKLRLPCLAWGGRFSLRFLCGEPTNAKWAHCSLAATTASLCAAPLPRRSSPQFKAHTQPTRWKRFNISCVVRPPCARCQKNALKVQKVPIWYLVLNWVETFVESCKKAGRQLRILLPKQITNDLLKLQACFLLIASQIFILKCANSWTLSKPLLSFTSLRRLF